jgi:hypothetical protein
MSLSLARHSIWNRSITFYQGRRAVLEDPDGHRVAMTEKTVSWVQSTGSLISLFN